MKNQSFSSIQKTRGTSPSFLEIFKLNIQQYNHALLFESHFVIFLIINDICTHKNWKNTVSIKKKIKASIVSPPNGNHSYHFGVFSFSLFTLHLLCVHSPESDKLSKGVVIIKCFFQLSIFIYNLEFIQNLLLAICVMECILVKFGD